MPDERPILTFYKVARTYVGGDGEREPRLFAFRARESPTDPRWIVPLPHEGRDEHRAHTILSITAGHRYAARLFHSSPEEAWTAFVAAAKRNAEEAERYLEDKRAAYQQARAAMAAALPDHAGGA